MEETTLTLDQELTQQDSSNPEANLASKGKRFVNMIIDMICYYVLVFILGAMLGIIAVLSGIEINNINKGFYYLLAFGAMFAYYSFFESRWGRTVGKMITKTRVVDEHGNNITFNKAANRSFCRLIPFEAFSFLNQRGVGLHDSITKTRVINDR